MWKNYLKQTSENTSLLVVEGHHLIRGSRVVILEELNSKELYSVLISKYVDKLFPNTELPWEQIYVNERKVNC